MPRLSLPFAPLLCRNSVVLSLPSFQLRHRCQPYCEVLEDRLAPATSQVLTNADAVGAVTNVGPGQFTAATLRIAVDAANATGGTNSITFAPSLAGQTITFSQDDTNNPTTFGNTGLVIGTAARADDLTITGDAAMGITLSQSGGRRLFAVDGAAGGSALTLQDTALSGGLASGGSGGGGYGGGASAGLGGAIFVDSGATLNVVQSALTGNQAQGGSNTINNHLGSGGGGGLAGGGNLGSYHQGGSGGGPNGGAGAAYGYSAGNGGFGGGGGGAYGRSGGNGGFGGGGGGAGDKSYGGNGGFGGGGGSPKFNMNSGNGGFGGGNGIAISSGLPYIGGGGAGMGGAIFSNGGKITITNSTITGNAASGAAGFSSNPGKGLGGGVFNRNGTLTILNSNVSGNSAAQGNNVYSLGDGDHSGGDDTISSTATVTISNSIMGQPNSSDFIGRAINGGSYTSNGFGTASPRYYVVSADAGGGPEVVVYNAVTGFIISSFYAFDPGFRGGVRVAVDDVNGDGIPDIIAAAGPGGGPQVEVIDGTKLTQLQSNGQIANSALLASFYAFASTFTGGVYVAAGTSSSGQNWIAAAAGPGGGPQVVVWTSKAVLTGRTTTAPTPLVSFYALTPTFTGGVSVALGDGDGDGKLDVIAGAGPGGGPQVTVVDGTKFSTIQSNGTFAGSALLASFYAFSPSFTGGVYVSGGVTTGTQFNLIVGAGLVGGPQVIVVNGAQVSQLASNGQIASSAVLGSFNALSSGFSGGVSVGFSAAFGSGGKSAILTAAGPSGGPQVAPFDGATFAALSNFFALSSGFSGGLFIAG